eukprot:CAMPEP_0172532328 /NCGR_PEP_ID=MMETSP1067-20121228/5426_1 /TAXON_ID=265564 ORGANISM="Thalassiosira punctigera, Strain Tpunct2005C2" /NCGR_SAMPLE_ID=MMETSP1067 /ASSEMBLY_ACC=CAM_ASM_000444 /LENGTH=476 /DNA_ID=CAMNT_0013316835 /DNA_START=63 /DNA_END=1493 /DNA_ORIENTATION=+
MALNNHMPYDSTDSEDDPWEMVGDETAPLATSQNNATSVPGDAGDKTENGVERESQTADHVPDGVDGIGRVGTDSFVSCVSSITGDHRTVSDVEDGEEDGVDDGEGGDALDAEPEVPTGTLLDLPEKLLGCDGKSKERVESMGEEMKAHYDEQLGRWVFPSDGPAEMTMPLRPPAMSPDETEYPATPASALAAELPKSEISDAVESPSNLGSDKDAPDVSAAASVAALLDKMEDNESESSGSDTAESEGSTAELPEKMDEEKPESSDLLKSLLNMGFEKEQVEKAIKNLREAGATEIDVDTIISEILGEKNDGGRTWDFVESTVRGFEEQHELRRRTQNLARNIGLSAQDLWSNVRNESQRFQANLREACDEADVRARTVHEKTACAATKVKDAASSAKDSACRANEEYGITDKVATAAVVGGAALLALGSPRAGVGAIAVAGATLAAGEAMKQSSARSSSTRTRDYGLGEGLHVD